VRVPAASADLPGAPSTLTDVWSGERVELEPPGAATAADSVIDVEVPAHGVRLLRLGPHHATA
jgi:hypothetical protein